MKVYRPAAHWMDDDRLSVPSGRKTGLLDVSGTELMSIDSSEPIGFVTDFSKVTKL